MFDKKWNRLCVVMILILFSKIDKADTVLIAVASNFAKPMNELAASFAKETGHIAKLSFGSSGKFVTQIVNGAPYHVFLSADEENPLKLEQLGLALIGSRFTYAQGKLVLWSGRSDYVDKQGEILSKGGFKHIALADPKLAPYGAAAEEVLKNLGLLEKLKPLTVQGENISQTWQFISTGNAELGFVALSQVIENGKIASGSGWVIPTGLHTAIRQDAVLLIQGAVKPAALEFMKYLKSSQSMAIIEKYGYDLPKD